MHGECGEGVGKVQRYSNGVYQCCMWRRMADSEERGVNGGMKKWVGRCRK